MSLNCITSCKRAGCSPALPSTDNFSPFYRNVWQYVGILLTGQNTAQQRCDCGTHHDRTFSVRYVVHAPSTLYQPVPHNHGVSCCRFAAEHQFRPEGVMRTDFHEPVRDSTRCLTGDRFRLSPDGFWCQNHRESDPAHYLRQYRNVFFVHRQRT